MTKEHNEDLIIDQDIDQVLSVCNKELKTLSGKSILITGASGFVGSYLVETIIRFNEVCGKQPCRLLLPTRNLSNLEKKCPRLINKKNIEWFEWDGQSDLKIPLTENDYIIHGAFPTNPRNYSEDPFDTMNSSIGMTHHILKCAKDSKIRSFLFLSSGAVYGEQPNSMSEIPEEYSGGPDLLRPDSIYGEAKRLCELLCNISGLPVTIARLFAFIGPYQDIKGSHAVPDFIRQASQENEISVRGDGKAIRGYCYSSDLTIILWKLLLQQNKEHYIYNVGSSDFIIDIAGLAKLVSEIIGDTKVNIRGSKNKTPAPRLRYVPKIKRIKPIYTPQVDIKTALTRTIQSYRNRHIIP